MEVTFFEDTLYYTLKINGEVDVSSSITLDNALESALKQTKKDILIDCHELEYISSSGIGVFTSRVEDCEKSGQKIILYGVSPKVMKVFSILGLDKLIPIYKSKEELNSLVDGGQNKG